MKKELYLHIGYPRTATKTLQTHFFPEHKQINYLGRHPKRSDLGPPHIDIISKIIVINDELFIKNKEFFLKGINSLNFKEDKINVKSSEFFVLSECLYNSSYQIDGSIISNSFFSKKSYDTNTNTLEGSVKRLKIILEELDINLKLFFSIREQSSEFKSLYIAASPESGSSFPVSGSQFIEQLKKKDNNFIQTFLKTFNYNLKYDLLTKILGKENVKVLVYEHLLNDRKFFCEELSTFLNINSGISYGLLKDEKRENSSNFHLNENLRLNNFFQILYSKIKKNIFNNPLENLNIFVIKKKFLNLFKLILTAFFKKKNFDYSINKRSLIYNVKIIEKNSDKIREIYKNENALLEKKIGYDLKKYNYL